MKPQTYLFIAIVLILAFIGIRAYWNYKNRIPIRGNRVKQSNPTSGLPPVVEEYNNEHIWRAISIIFSVLVVAYFVDRWMDQRAINPVETSSQTPWVRTTGTPSIYTETRIKEVVLNNLSRAYDIPKSELQQLLANTGNSLNEDYRIALWTEYGITTPSDIASIESLGVQIPSGTKIHRKVKVNKTTWSRPISKNGWANSYQTPNGMDDRLEYLYDAGTSAETHVIYDVENNKRVVKPDGSLGDILSPTFGGVGNVRIKLPSFYLLPTDAATGLPVVDTIDVVVASERVN